LTDEEFEQLAAANRDLRLGVLPTGELIIMPPAGEKAGKHCCLTWLIDRRLRR